MLTGAAGSAKRLQDLKGRGNSPAGIAVAGADIGYVESAGSLGSGASELKPENAGNGAKSPSRTVPCFRMDEDAVAQMLVVERCQDRQNC